MAATFDGTSPTATIADFILLADGSYRARISLSEPAANLVLGGIRLVNATGRLSGGGTDYTLVVTPVADGLVSAQVMAGSFTDAAGNANAEASNLVSFTHDGAAPTVVITGVPDTFVATASFSVTVLFSEPAQRFDVNGLVAVNAMVTAVGGSGERYTATIRAQGAGDVVLQVRAGAAQDMAGNANRASQPVRVANRTVAETQGQIARFMLHRADQLVSNQPGLICLMRGTCSGGGFGASATEHGMQFNLSTMSSPLTAHWPVWMQLRGSRSKDPSGDTDYLIGTIGAHHKFSETLYLGAMLQFDHAARKDGIGRIEGSGWLAGPYVVGRLPDHPVYFEGRLLWGQTRNSISPFGTYSDGFQTERMLAMARVTGEVALRDLTLMPTFALSHTTDRQLAYTDSLGNVIGSQDIALTRLELGIEAKWPVTIGLSDWIFEGGIRALHSHGRGSGLSLADAAPVDGTRGRIDLGFTRYGQHGRELSMSGYYDGIGQSGYEGYGLAIRYRRDF